MATGALDETSQLDSHIPYEVRSGSVDNGSLVDRVLYLFQRNQGPLGMVSLCAGE